MTISLPHEIAALSAKELFEKYCAAWLKKSTEVPFAERTVLDVSKRLRQMHWLVHQAKICVDQHTASSVLIPEMVTKTLADAEYHEWVAVNVDIVDRMELFTESFYWVAHRGAVAIRQLPGLRSFEATGVRDVRNNVLEHPEKRHGVPALAFGWGSPSNSGPTIATATWNYDKGLYVNAIEFFEEVKRVTALCIADPSRIA